MQYRVDSFDEVHKVRGNGWSILQAKSPCLFGLVVSMSASHTVSREFASRPGHTKDHHKNGTNCLPAWHAMR